MKEIGRDALFIELLEDYPCQKREELLRNEGEKMREHQSELSKIISGRSKKQYRQENSQQTQEKQSEFYEWNRPQLIQYQKNYRNNREMLKLKKNITMKATKNKQKKQKHSITTTTRTNSKKVTEHITQGTHTRRTSVKGKGKETITTRINSKKG